MPGSSTSTAPSSPRPPSCATCSTRRTIASASASAPRRTLADEYARRYAAEILDHADLLPIASGLSGLGKPALLCVERDPEACHRSLIAQRLAERYNAVVEHLHPA